HLDLINDHQLRTYHKKQEKEKLKPVTERKTVKANLFSQPTKENPFVSYNLLDALFKHTNQKDYRSLPAQSSQWVMKSAYANWESFFTSIQDYRVNPHKYRGRPRIPGYAKRHLKEITSTNQDCIIKDQKYLKFPKTKLQLNIGKLG